MKVKTPKVNTEKIIMYVLPIGLFLGSVLIFVVFGLSKIGPIRTLREEIADKETRFVTLRSKTEKLADMLAYKSSLEEDKDVFEYAIPSQSEVPTFMTQIEDIASESNVGLSTLQYGGEGKERENQKYLRVKISVTVRGSFNDIRTFLSNLEKSSRLVIVDSIRFSSGVESEGSPGLLTANISVHSPYIKEVKKPSLEQPLMLDLNSKEFLSVLNAVKDLKVYSREVDPSGVGKQDPFAK